MRGRPATPVSDRTGEVLKRYYRMLYPDRLQEEEYIRLVALQKYPDGTSSTLVRFVRTFDEYRDFVLTYRYDFDLFGQLATNYGTTSGSTENQFRRKVLFLDFDRKDFPEMKTAQDCTDWIHRKLPKLFVHAIVDSGHGFHCYISVPETADLADLVAINRAVAEVVGADPKAVSPTQIARIPCSYNLKDSERPLVKVVINTYGRGRFRPLDLRYIRRMAEEYAREQKTEEALERVHWHYEALSDAPDYLCIRRAMEEGVDQGQRNFWHGRIVAMLKKEGYTPSRIHQECQEFNLKCRPPKSHSETEKDTERYLAGQYKLLGCYEAFPEGDPRRQWVYDLCDKAHCATHRAGQTIAVEGAEPAKINRKALDNKALREADGIGFLVMTIIDVYADTYGRRGFRISNLEKLLHSSVAKKQCVGKRKLREVLADLVARKFIELVPDKKHPSDYGQQKIKLSRRLEEFQKGYVQFYFSVAVALIDGKISPVDYKVFLCLVRNLQCDHKAATYQQLADDLNMDPQNIGRSIRKLREEHCLLIRKQPTESGREYNRYQVIDPDIFSEDGGEIISLLA